MIKIENVTKIFTDRKGNAITAVDAVNLTIHDGEIFGIIGFSGAGKSTLVRCINLLERPTSGRIFLDDTELTALSDRELYEQRRHIGMIFQHFNLMPSRTVLENVMLPLRHSKLSAEEKLKKCRELLALVELEDKHHNYPSQLSGGQQQRVAIARALANDPKVLLCDEATSALDPQTTHQILGLLKQLNEKLGLTIVIITHQMSVVKKICDHAAVMEKGRIMEEGPVLEIFSHPKAPITRSFIENATPIGAFYELFERGTLPGRTPGQPVWLLTFRGEATGQALISRMALKYKIEANILFGHVDFIRGGVLGKLAISLDGPAEQIARAREYFISCGVEVEEMKDA